MKKNTNKKSSVIILIVLLLISSLNFLTTVSASAYQDNNDGVWLDDFEDASEIDTSKSSNYNQSAGLITLKSGINIHYYDYNDINQEAWESNLTFISGEKTLIRLRNPPLEVSFSYDAIKKKKDGKVIETEAGYINNDIFDITYTFSPVHHFRFKIGQNKNNINDFKFSWWYGSKISDANVDYIQLYVWNYLYKSLGVWTLDGDAVSYDDINTSANGDIYFTSNNTKYVSDDGYIDFLVVAIPKENGESCILTTDYVNLTVATKQGYFDEGHVVSNEIKPGSSLFGWESIVWKGSRVNNAASITIQVLKADGSTVNDNDLPGNSKGFTTSPIDISQLPISIGSIRLKALFNSSDLSVTPRLCSWGVTWQTRAKQFTDSFSTDLRIDKNVGVDINIRKITISDYYSDWAIFGKNPANTRSYEGYGPQKSELYWNTKQETVGGGFRSPVMSRGVIYIPSSFDNTIYAFNATVPYSGKGKELLPFESSDPLYIVDASVAVADDFVIVATSEINASNKIYALDKSNLKDEKWNYSYPGDICFSSAPTVDDGKVFVTSWNGKIWDTPLLSPLLSLSFLKNLISGNSKIIALNLVDGSKLWVKDLPAGSFSTPAVADGKVFVGCDNIGSNLFALDEETGKELWNKNIGLIGGASPVVSDGKVFIVAKKQGLLSIKGDVKLFALNENNGSIIWNKTLAKNIPAFESLPKGLHFYNLMPTSTPAVKEDTKRLFVTSPDGKLHAFSTDGTEIWNITLPSAVYGVIPTYSCTSPVVADDDVYVASTNGVVHALNASNGEKLWEFTCGVTENPELLAQTFILASPIVADGIIYVSSTEELGTFSGSIYSIGNYTKSEKARVVSNPIHVPTGNWWNTFYADFTTPTGSSIKFSILDENYNTLLKLDGVKSNVPISISGSSKLNSNVIKLCAEFSRKDQNPTLHNWSVTWYPETNAPVFSSFSPGGWINTNTPTCTIEAKDTKPGLDIDSAKYQIKYKSEENKTITTDPITAYCSGIDGTKDEQLTANISELNLSKHIVDLINIKISIKDLSGNEATFQQNFQMDTVKPTSQINGEFSDINNKPVAVKANASDGKSGVKNVALYYRYSSDNDNWGDWKTFGNSNTKRPYEWLYNGKVNESGYYKLCTIATDNASNKEDFPTSSDDERIVSFLYDAVAPHILTEFTVEYRFNKLPEFSIEFGDDFKLDKVEYRLNFNTNWTLIKDNINSKSYTDEWNIAKDDWDYMAEKEEYSLYFKLTDFCGNQYITPENKAINIIKDLTTSKSYLDLSDLQDFHLDDKFTIATNLHGEKNITKMALYYRYSADKEEWSKWKQYGKDDSTKPFEWKFTANEGSGYYEFYTKVWDSSGIVGESEPESINVALFPMTAVIVMIFLAILLILISAFILIRMKKKKT